MKDKESEIVTRSLVHRITWLIKLRWLAATGVLITITVSKYVLEINLNYLSLYVANGWLFLYNFVFFVYNQKLNQVQKDTSRWHSIASVFTNVQISLDFFLLAYFVHLSGGPENPLIFYFVFHMVIASIILSNRAAFLQATLSVVLVGFVVTGEYLGFIKHHHLGFFFQEEICFIENRSFILTYFIFVTTLYITTYFATSIVNELRGGERELEKANVLLEQKDRAKSQYVKTVSHDLKSSLATVQSCLRVVLDGLTGKMSEKTRDMISRAEQRTRKLNHFVKELWSLSRMRVIEDFQKKAVGLVTVIEEVASQLKPILEERRLKLELIDHAGRPVVSANDYMMEELFVNLLDNAVKYSLEGKKITIVCEESRIPRFIQVSIQDEGIGIPEESFPRIFDDFYRAENAKMIDKEGTGLGLSIVKQILEMVGGEIWVESSQNRGSTFTFTLPRAP